MVGDTVGEALRLQDAQRLRRYREYLDFYNGLHFDRARRGRSNLVLNYARTIVDKGVSFLMGRGLNFAVPTPDVDVGASALGGRPMDRAQLAESLLYQTYQDNDLEAVDLQAAVNGFVLGDTVFKVFWDLSAGRVRVVNQDPFGFFASWTGDDLGTLRRVEIAYSIPGEEAELLYGMRSSKGAVEVVERWTPAEFALAVGGKDLRAGPNPYGFIPFLHIPNSPPPNEFWGRSDLADLISLNRELDERMSDMADIIRYHADPPIIFKGVSEHGDLAVGPGTVWDIPKDAEVKLLEWHGQPVAVQEHIGQVFRALYETSETPRTAFGDSGRLLSGVALETELRPLIQKTLRKRAFWTPGLRRRNAMILRLIERFTPGLGEGYFAPYRSKVIWPAMMPRDDEADVRNNVALVNAGLRSHRSAMDALGVESPEQELARILEEQSAVSGQQSAISHQPSAIREGQPAES